MVRPLVVLHPSPGAMIKLRTLGQCVIEIGGEAFTPESDALFAALLYLCVERGKRVPRDRLAELIWPRTTPRRARHCLRQILYRLRMLGVEFDGAREHVLLPDAAVAPTFSAAPAPDRLAAERSAGTLVVGPFLPGYRPPHSEPYAEWLDATRAELESRVRRSILELAQVHRLRGEWADVDALARDCIRLDPLNEEANLAIAEAAAMTGGKSEAIAILDRYIHDLGARGNDLRLPATVLRRRIAERFPARRYSVPSDRCFVGRAALLETLATALLRARNGESSALMLTGAPGIGKTRLVQELTSLAVMQGVRTVRVGCDEADAQRPMSAWVDAVPRLRELPGALGIAPESLRFLRRLTEIDPTDAVLAEPLRDPRWIANRIRQAIVDLLDAVTAEGTVLLVIEDVHWLDGPSWAAITALLEWMTRRRFLLVLTTRGLLARDGAPTRCLEKIPVHVVTPLGVAASSQLGQLIATDHGGVLTAEALRWCVEVGEGNPLFIRELVVHCLEGGAPHAVPPTLQVLIDGRIARLARPTRRILEAAAILNGLSNVARIEKMLDLPTHELANGLEELGEVLLISDSNAAVAPRHELVRSRVMATMSNPVRFLLHRRAALLLEEEIVRDVTPEGAYALIDHWRSAESNDRCVPAIIHAATHFMRLGAPRDVADLLAKSRSILGDTEHSRAALALQMRALALTAQWKLAHEVAHELARSSDAAGLDNTGTAAQLMLLESGFRIGNDPDLLYRRASEIAADHRMRASDRIASARLGIMIAESSSSSLDQGELWRAISDLRQGGDELGIELGVLEMIYEVNVGEMTAGIAIADRLLSSIPASRDDYQRLSTLLAISDAFRVGGRHADALGVAYEAARLARETGSEHFEISASSRVIAIHTDLGELREAQAILPQLEARVAQSGDEFSRLTALALNARLALLTGRSDDAKTAASLHYELVCASAFDSRERMRIAVTLLAEVLLSSDADPLPDVLLDQLKSAHIGGRSRPMHDYTMAVLYLALVRSGRAIDARETLSDYLGRHRRAARPWAESVKRLGLAATAEASTSFLIAEGEAVMHEIRGAVSSDERRD